MSRPQATRSPKRMTTTHWVLVAASIGMVIGSYLDSYLRDRFIDEPCADAQELNEAVDSGNTTLRNDQAFLAGYQLAMRKQLESGGDIAPSVLQTAAQLTKQAEGLHKKAEHTRQYVESEAARRHLAVDPNKLIYAQIVLGDQLVSIDDLKIQIASIEFNKGVNLVARQLEREEATCTKIEAMIANDGVRLSGDTRQAILAEQQRVTGLVGAAEQTAKALSQNNMAQCREHGAGCRKQATADLQERADRLRKRFEKLRQGVLAARDDHNAA